MNQLNYFLYNFIIFEYYIFSVIIRQSFSMIHFVLIVFIQISEIFFCFFQNHNSMRISLFQNIFLQA
jgi:hypothetical protein